MIAITFSILAVMVLLADEVISAIGGLIIVAMWLIKFIGILRFDSDPYQVKGTYTGHRMHHRYF